MGCTLELSRGHRLLSDCQCGTFFINANVLSNGRSSSCNCHKITPAKLESGMTEAHVALENDMGMLEELEGKYV